MMPTDEKVLATNVAAIPTLFRQWKAVRGREFATDEESRAGHREYRKLQRTITAMTPTSARDLAIQMVVETDFGDSDWRDSFFQKVARISEA